MSAQVLTIETLTVNTKSTDLVAGANMTSCAANDTFTLTPTQNRTEDLIIAIKFSGSGTVTFTAGSNPPGTRGALGTVVITGSNSEARIVMVEAARLFSSAKPATIVGTVTGATCLIGAFRIPRTL